MTTTLPCPRTDKSGTVCGEPFTVEIDGDRWTAYTPPACHHHVSPRYLTEQARRVASERAPDPLRAETPDPDSGAVGEAVTERAGATCMRLVIVESPYAGDVERNVAYARAAVRDSLSRGEAPIASHLLYTQPGVLDDGDPVERQWGIDAGLAWRRVAEATVVYTDLGISRGMEYGIRAAEKAGLPVERRTLPGWTL